MLCSALLTTRARRIMPFACVYRPLEPAYAERWVTTEVGKRGGLSCPGTRPHIAITFEEYLADQQAWLAEYGSWATTDHLKKGSVPGGHISLPVATNSTLNVKEPHEDAQVQVPAVKAAA